MGLAFNRWTSPSHYQAQLVFSTLSSSMDSGNYECSVTINSNSSLLYMRSNGYTMVQCVLVMYQSVIMERM